MFFFFKQKTAYEMRISDWSSDLCSSDLPHAAGRARPTRKAPAPVARVGAANEAARVEPRRDGFINAMQRFVWSEGALYQVYAAPGQITDIALQPGEQLVGAGPVAAGDTVRWIIGEIGRASCRERVGQYV